VEAAGIEDMQGRCDKSLRDATLPRTSPRFFENLTPVITRCATGWRRDDTRVWVPRRDGRASTT